MAIMKPHLPLLEGESLVSWLSRFALFHCGMQLESFLKMICVTQQNLLIGDEAVFSRIAEITGVPVGKLRKHSYFKVSGRLYGLRDETFFREFLVRNRVTFCPACLLSDTDATQGGHKVALGRTNWAFAPVRTCSVHNVPLIRNLAENSQHMIFDVANSAPCEKTLKELLQQSKSRKPSGLQCYVEERLAGQSGSPWMDSQRIDLASRAAEMLGACIVFGAHVALSKLSEDDWDAAGRTGYEFTARGENGIREGLEHIYRRSLKSPAQSGPQGVFGKLYQWAQFKKNEKPIGPFADVLREYILDTFPMEPGTMLFNEEVDRTRRHSVGSLSAKYSVHVKTVKHALQKSGLLTVESSNDMRGTVPADQAENLIEKLTRAVPVAKIPRYIGCTRTHAEHLVKSGILSSVLEDEENASGRYKGVDSRDLDQLIERMRQFGKPVEKAGPSMADVRDAAQAVRVPFTDIVSLLLDRRLKDVELLSPDLKFRSVLVNIGEVAIEVGAVTGETGVTISDAAKEIGVVHDVIRFLLSAEDDEGLRVLKICGKYRHMGIMRDLIEPDSLITFQKRYRKLSKIEGYWVQEPNRLRLDLARKGVMPAWDPMVAGADLYRVSDL